MAKGIVKRSIAGIIMGVILIVGMLTPYTFSLIVSFAIVVMMNEYYDMAIDKKKYCLEKLLATITVVSAFILSMSIAQFNIDTRYLMLLFLPLVALMSTLLFDPIERSEDGHKMENIIFPMMYIGVPMMFLPSLMYNSLNQYTWHLFIFSFILIWMSDVGAYVLGMAFGQRPNSKKLCPQISPKKSWIGVFGGFLFTTIGAIIIYFTKLVEIKLFHLIIISFLVLIFGILGDLFESLVKRKFGVKDSGTIMPGHGGLLDRFDGALFVLPIVAIYIELFSIL